MGAETLNVRSVTAIFMVLLGCGLNNVFLEYIIKLDPGSGHLITFAQFLFIAIHGFIFTSRFGNLQAHIPKKNYMVLVIMFFATSVVNNWAFNFNVPVPLHMIFRAGSLIANMIMGVIILKKRYTLDKYVSVIMITCGIVICTVYTSSHKTKQTCSDCEIPEEVHSEDDEHLYWLIIGVILLTLALLLSARMGIYQEFIYKKYGKHSEEAKYYTHLYSLPGFLMYSSSIWEHAKFASQSSTYELPYINIDVPLLWIYLIFNVLTQYVCISSVYFLTAECSSLTVTLVITLRKFMSLVISILYFKNPFTLVHWFGTALVFIGTLIFTEVFKRKEKVKSS